MHQSKSDPVQRTSTNRPEVNDSVLGLISDFCVDKEVILVGDFNLPTVNWCTDPPRAASTTDCPFLDTFISLGLTQWVHESTYPRSGNILDLVLTSEPDRIGMIEVLPPLPGCDHSPTAFEYAFALNPMPKHDQSRVYR